MQFLKKTITSLCILLLFVSSCTYSKKIDLYHIHKENTEVERTIAQSKEYLRAGDFNRAIDVHRASFARYPNDQKLLKSYVKTLEDIRNVADRTFDKKDFARAGKTYYVLRKNYAHFKNFDELLSFDAEFLNERLTECRTYLSRKGMEQYRKRHFNEAIVIWKNLLVFDPDNAYIKNAIDTATVQARTLEGKK